MLFKEKHLHGIKAGTVQYAFRKWDKAAVKEGSEINTTIGLLRIDSITEVSADSITTADSLKAGFTNKQDLLDSFRPIASGKIFKMEIRYLSEDPRIKLRERVHLHEEELHQLSKRLANLDLHGAQGPWTRKILSTIAAHPHLRAVDLASLTGFEKEWLKLHIRKLKNLGLTISHPVGYEISPLGKHYLQGESNS